MAGGPHDGAHCRSVLLPDTVAEADALGTFAPVCDALESLIRHQPGGRTIGLKGEWGAGKSTLVSLLKKRFQRDESILFVLFDSWTSKGSPLHRAFLEELVRQCQGWLSEKQRADWKDALDKLSGRVVETTIRSSTKLTWQGNLLAASLLVVPFGSAIVEGVVPSIAPDLTGSLHYLAILGTILATFPLWVFAVLRLTKGENEDTLSLLLDRGDRVETHKQSRDPDPTAIEFQKAYLSLLSEITQGRPDRRLVLVVDNMDRVTSDEADRIWATLQSFFVLPDSDAARTNQVWVLVPYAADSMESWARRKSADREIQRSFVDKSLQAVFEVPVPVLSNWRSHLIELLSSALPDHDKADFNTVYLVYARRFGDVQHEPTPRDLLLFANQLVALHLQHGHSFPLAHLALYAVLLRSGKRPSQELLGTGWPSRQEEWNLGSSLADNIAAIWFGTDTGTARQLLYRAPLVTAIQRRDSEGLRMLLKHPGAVEVFAFVASEQAKMAADGGSSATLASLSAVIAASGFSEARAVDASTRSRVMKDIAGALKTFDQWELGDVVTLGMPAALRMIADPQVTLHAFHAFMKTAAALIQDTTRTRDGVNRFNVRTFLALADVMDAEGLSSEYSGGLELCGAITDLTPALPVLDAPIASGRLHLLHLPTDSEADYFARLLQPGPLKPEAPSLVRLAKALGANANTRQFSGLLSERLTASPENPNDELKLIVEMLLLCRNDPLHRAALTEFAKKGVFVRLFSSWKRQGNLDGAGLAIASHMCGQPKLRIGSQPGVPPQATNDLDDLTREQPLALVQATAKAVARLDASGALEETRKASPAFSSFLDSVAAHAGEGKASFDSVSAPKTHEHSPPQ